MLKHLSLFTGAGGELLASQHLHAWRSVGYVEWDDYRQRVLAQRIKDDFLNNAPIFSNIDTFISEGYAGSYTGLVDVITAGFPCQGWSTIGKQLGEQDPRNKWPETREVIQIVKPRQILLENSPRIMSTGFIFQIIEDLSALGYVGRATRLSGLHVGAYSKRERAWIKAELSDPIGLRLQGWHNITEKWEAKNRSIQGLGKDQLRVDLPDPRTFRVNHGDSSRVDRTKAIGDMQIPKVAATAWEIL